MRVDLGKDQWAEIFDVEDVPRRVKARVQEWALNRYKADEDHPALVHMTMRDMLIAYVVVAWSYGELPGGEPERLGDLPSSAYDKLLAATEKHVDDLDFLRESPSYSDSKTSSKAKSSPAASRRAGTSAP